MVCFGAKGNPSQVTIHQRPAVNASVVKAPTAICLERNRRREGAAQVPEFSIEHMAEVFEWPSTLGKTWEAQDEMKKTEDNHGGFCESLVFVGLFLLKNLYLLTLCQVFGRYFPQQLA